MVALMAVLPRAARSRNLKTPPTVSKHFAPRAKVVRRNAPARVSRELPPAMASTVQIEPCVTTLTAKAPIKTPGQRRLPHSNSAARAIPLGGQTAEALGFIDANESPN